MDIEKSREIRLWVTRVGIPVMITGVIVLMNPEVRGYIKSLTNKKKEDRTNTRKSITLR